MTTHPTGDAPAANEDREVTPLSTPFFDAVQSGRIKPDEGDVASESVVEIVAAAIYDALTDAFAEREEPNDDDISSAARAAIEAYQKAMREGK